MSEPSRHAPVDFGTLAEFLAALAYPTRLELLYQLRFPAALGDIRLSPLRLAPGENPERPASRQTIQAHLDKLVEADLVRAERVESDGRAVNRYATNPQRLYALTEELRRLSTIYAGRGSASDATGTLAPASAQQAARGPRLVLVHGAYEGKAFPLTAQTLVDGAWTIGRKRGSPVTLDYDPFVSLENTAVVEREGRFHARDLKGSKNGTSVNWVPIAKDLDHPLATGDVIGVGRSLLSFVRE